MISQIDKAELFRGLHVPHNPLILYNIWDAGSAKVVARAGAKAIATGSWSVAAAQGFEDGEKLPLENALAVIARIMQRIALPVTVDFEGGYAADPEMVGQNIRRLLAHGVVGLNFEDQVVNAPGLYRVEDQVARLRAVREAADALGVPAFIHARTDVFLKAAPEAEHASLLGDALARAAARVDCGMKNSGAGSPCLTKDPKLISYSGSNKPPAIPVRFSVPETHFSPDRARQW